MSAVVAAGLGLVVSALVALDKARTGCVSVQSRSTDRVDAPCVPPAGFIAGAVKFAVMAPAQWHGELVADLEAETPRLGKAHMVGIAGLPGADQAGLFGDKPEVGLVAVAAQFRKGQHALVDSVRFGLRRRFRDPRRKGRLVGRGCRFGISLGRSDGTEFGLKGLLDPAGVVSGERILRGQAVVGPAIEVLAYTSPSQFGQQLLAERR